MKTKTALVLITAAAGFGFSLAQVFAQKPKMPVTSYRVAFENEKVRVLDYFAAPGGEACGFGKHYHPAHLAILLTDAKVRIKDAQGKTTIEDGKAGEMFWSPAETHEVEDVSGKQARCYVVEIKDSDWKPSTGLTK
jgi:hypothetical protein